MKVNRQKFLLHLERLFCGGQIPEAVISGGFASTALTPDQMLLVVAPDIPAVEPLKEAIGVAEVKTLLSALSLLKGEGNLGVEVNVYVEDNRLVINDGDRGVQELIIAAPQTIATRIDKETVDEVLEGKPKGKNVPLTRAIVDGVRGAFSLYKAEEIEVHIGKESEIIVGTSRTNRARFKLDISSKEEYVLVFGKHVVDVFGIISDYSSASFRLGGPDQPILVEDGGYRYLLSPRIRSADESIKSEQSEGGEVGGEEVEAEEAPAPTKKTTTRKKK